MLDGNGQPATFPTRQACGSHSHGPSFGETTFEASQAYQGLWDNWNGTGDAFVLMWAKVTARFKALLTTTPTHCNDMNVKECLSHPNSFASHRRAGPRWWASI